MSLLFTLVLSASAGDTGDTGDTTVAGYNPLLEANVTAVVLHRRTSLVDTYPTGVVSTVGLDDLAGDGTRLRTGQPVLLMGSIIGREDGVIESSADMLMLAEPRGDHARRDLFELVGERPPSISPRIQQLLEQSSQDLSSGLETTSGLPDGFGPSGDQYRVIATFWDEEPLPELARPHRSMSSVDPDGYLASMEERLIGIQQRWTEVETRQAVEREALLNLGASVRSLWIINGLEVEGPVEAVAYLAMHPRLKDLQVIAEPVQLATMPKLRNKFGVQMKQYWNSGFTGEDPIGAYWDVNVGVLDSGFNLNHPIWLDTASGSSRVENAWTVGVFWSNLNYTQYGVGNHANEVAGIILGDLTDGQDPSVATNQRHKKTGVAKEASLSFVQVDESHTFVSEAGFLQKLADQSPDVTNWSGTIGDYNNHFCDHRHNVNDVVDEMFAEGIFHVNSAGNSAGAAPCNITVPGVASGTFTIGGLNTAGAGGIDGRPLWVGSSRTTPSGVGGRMVLDMVAPMHIDSGLPSPTGDSGYHTPSVFGTSHAAPWVTGSAALMKEHLVDQLGQALGNDPGILRVSMLLGGDSPASAGLPGLSFGVGRTRFRLFNGAGLDAPFRGHWYKVDIFQGSGVWDFPLNPDGSGNNQPVQSNVDGCGSPDATA